MENVTLKPKEQTPTSGSQQLARGAHSRPLDQAATLIGVSPRHTRRIRRITGREALHIAHGHRGRKPANAVPETTRSMVPDLAARCTREPTTPISQSGSVNARARGRTTLRRILVNAGQ